MSRSGGIFDFENKQERLEEVDRELADPNVWDDQDRAQTLNKERSQLEAIVGVLTTLAENLSDASELAELNVATLGALGAAGVATEGVMGDSEVPSGLLDEAGRSSAGAGQGGTAGLNFGGSGSGAVRPGAGGGGKSLKNIGETGGQKGGG